MTNKIQATNSATAFHAAPVTHHRTAEIDGLNIFYREAGPAAAPAVLHGFPTSSHMFHRKFHWPLRRRPDNHQSLSDLAL
jgi:pimeloyl-ACP methyl ester carboxylesterase